MCDKIVQISWLCLTHFLRDWSAGQRSTAAKHLVGYVSQILFKMISVLAFWWEESVSFFDFRHLFNMNCSLFNARWCLNVSTVQIVNYLAAKVSTCWVCLPITLKGQMVIIHDCERVHMLVCVLLRLWMSETVIFCNIFAEILVCLCRCTPLGINDNWCEITDTQFSSMQLKRRQRADILHVFQHEDKLVSQGPFLYFADNAERRRRAVSDVFLQVLRLGGDPVPQLTRS